MRVGVISDTHGLVREEALKALAESDFILHAGDIGGPHVLQELQTVAPVIAVRGNVDSGPWAASLPEDLNLDLAGVRLHLVHDVKAIRIDPEVEGIQMVIAGHSHQAYKQRLGDVVFFNPGAAGPRRFSLPLSVGRLILREGTIHSARIIFLDEPGSTSP
jgi:putative phosphoesterase